MPIYPYRCQQGHEFSKALPVAQYVPEVDCTACGCHAERVFTVPLSVMVQQDVHYRSPVTGEPICSMAARREDLARTDSIPFDPGMKQDRERRQRDSQKELETAIEHSVAEEIHRMPTWKREQLTKEVVGRGTELEVRRATA